MLFRKFDQPISKTPLSFCMENIIQSVITSFLVSFISIPVVITVASSKKLFDLPGNRKLHDQPIPHLGGVVFFASVLLSCTLFTSFVSNPELQFFIAASVIIFFFGIKDDLVSISPFKKFTGQLIAAFILVYLGKFQINSLYGFLGYGTMNSFWSIVFTVVTVLLIINAYNLIDGINGLAASLGILSCSIFGVYFYLANDISYAVLSFSMVASLVAFIYYNKTPAKIFMGDAGSLFLGLVNAALVIKFIKIPNLTSFGISQSAFIGLSFIFIPVVDALRLFTTRIFMGRSPFSSDTNHIHHLLLRFGLSHLKVTGIIIILSSLIIGLSFFVQSFGLNLSVFSIFGVGFLIPYLLIKLSPKSLEDLTDNDLEIGKVKSITTTVISIDSESRVINN